MAKLLLVTLVLQYYIYFFSEANPNILPEQVHIAFGDNPSEIVVTWNTQAETPTAFVDYRAEFVRLKHRANGETKLFVDGGKRKRKQFVHRVYLKNLKPSTLYVYVCGSSLGISKEFSFKTVPNDTDWSPRLAIFGDMGEKQAVSLPFLLEEAKTGSYDAFIHVGDFAYDMKDRNGAKGDEFMRMIQPIASQIPYMVCPGNHERHYNFSHFKERFSMPGTKENLYYSFNLGPAHFISIDTEFYFYLEYGAMQILHMYEWLENDLKEANLPENRSVRPWIITYGHRPMYCSNTNHGCLKEESLVRKGLDYRWFGLEDLFYKYGVDVSMWGHEHSYERLWPVYNNTVKIDEKNERLYVNPGAPVHITTGSAGCWEMLSDFSEQIPEWSAKRLSLYGYSTMHVMNTTHLLIQEHAIDEKKHLADEVMIIKHKHRYGS
ncbi:hypothetical protein GE061_011927 [Apolygus lucorum]|uniref:Purple acid phosphatase n=1 Tax=Apolygus lucorum TaxID=248454 RepID=A0A8S9XUY8_APOLU|nr:hypothetical protein GE061_011927 [Apolygus lucorum]